MPTIFPTVRLDRCDKVSHCCVPPPTSKCTYTHWPGHSDVPPPTYNATQTRALAWLRMLVSHITPNESGHVARAPSGPGTDREGDHAQHRQQEKSDPTQHRSIPMRGCMGARRLHHCTMPSHKSSWPSFSLRMAALSTLQQRATSCAAAQFACHALLLIRSAHILMHSLRQHGTRTHLNSSHQVVGNARKFSYVLALSWPTDSSRCTHAPLSLTSRTDVFCALMPAPYICHTSCHASSLFLTQAVTPAACICHTGCHASSLHLSQADTALAIRC
jgi:hypothetical protein